MDQLNNNLQKNNCNSLNSKKGAFVFSKSRYHLRPYYPTRNFMKDGAVVTRKMNMINFVSEIDVTEALELMQKYKNVMNKSLSFTTFIICCFVKAVEEHKMMQGYRKNRRKITLFNEIDIFVAIEKKIKDCLQPFYLIIRNAEQKSFFEIQDTIRLAKEVDYKVLLPLLDRLFFTFAPTFIRNLFFSSIRKFPKLQKVFKGTIGVTSIGMFGKGASSMIPLMPFTTSLSIGTIDKKPRLIDGRLVNRDFLNIVLSCDHDIVDGSPALRFIERFKEFVAGCYSLQAVAETLKVGSNDDEILLVK